ncbi:MAG TPA: antibiotic biosynthesis monooxygenase [Dehalococcoidia bacterium]|jgi:quinol monooxygenase YgiN|nr:antibiotic biosynthesis monooxygenase [Dehalococcoidia bacterium]
MLYIRMSLMTPRAGSEHDVAAIMDDLVAYYGKQPGFVKGYKLMAADESGDIGRITVWRSQEAADATAQTEHVLAKRSELAPLLVPESHIERSFHAEEGESLLTQLLRTLHVR